MGRWTLAAPLVALLVAGGCEVILGIQDASDGSGNIEPGQPDAGLPDQGDGGSTAEFSALGMPCGPDFGDTPFGGECPPNSVCVAAISDLGDPAGNGYCSPMCNGDNAVCQDNYGGPPDNPVGCVLDSNGLPPPDPAAAALCGIGCAGDVCPDPLICLSFSDGAGGTINGCGGPTWMPLQ